jgi:two-component system LytT family sensor kinase
MGFSSPLRRQALNAAILTIPAGIVATQLYVGYRMRGIAVPFAAVLVLQLCHWELWAIAGPIVWRLEERWPGSPPRRVPDLVRHAIAAVVVAAALLAGNLVLYHVVIRLPGTAGWFSGLDRSVTATATFFAVSYFHLELLVYAAIVAAANAVRTTALLRARERETLTLETELTRARLTALRAQLQPHFLFNTLHTIGSLVLQEQADRAMTLLAELGELLRGALAHREVDLAPLRDEIAYLRRYLTIEEARFGDRLQVEWDIEPETLDALVPPFILQPLVENAFRHGIARRTESSRLKVGAVAVNGSVRVTIYNDGPPLAGSMTSGDRGFGLRNVIDRLQTRSPAGRLELTNEADGVQAALVMPLWRPTPRGAA